MWFHAPSVGEGLQARPVIDLLRAKRPDIQIAYSFFSPSAENFAASLNVDVADFLPFDSANDMRAMLDAIRPSVLFFSKLDVWPNLVAASHSRGVPVGLLSGTVSPRSGRQGKFARAVLRDAYAALDTVGAIDEANASRLVSLGAQRERTSVSGDTRFDQVWTRAEHVNRDSDLLRALRSTRPTLVAGSTWPADEAVLLPAWSATLSNSRGAAANSAANSGRNSNTNSNIPTRSARLIIAPHEPTAAHIDPIVRWASAGRLFVQTLAEVLAPASATSSDARAREADVIVVDRVGVLGDIYAIADIAFVGGAFHKAGLHSVLEPAAYGVPVLFGPSYEMSREAGLLMASGGAASVSSAGECAAKLTTWLGDADARKLAGGHARDFVQSELGAAERSLALVLRAIG